MSSAGAVSDVDWAAAEGHFAEGKPACFSFGRDVFCCVKVFEVRALVAALLERRPMSKTSPADAFRPIAHANSLSDSHKTLKLL